MNRQSKVVTFARSLLKKLNSVVVVVMIAFCYLLIKVMGAWGLKPLSVLIIIVVGGLSVLVLAIIIKAVNKRTDSPSAKEVRKTVVTILILTVAATLAIHDRVVHMKKEIANGKISVLRHKLDWSLPSGEYSRTGLSADTHEVIGLAIEGDTLRFIIESRNEMGGVDGNQALLVKDQGSPDNKWVGEIVLRQPIGATAHIELDKVSPLLWIGWMQIPGEKSRRIVRVTGYYLNPS